MTGDTPGLGQQGSHGLQLQASLTHDAGTGSQRGTLTLLLRPCMQQAGGAPRGQFQAPVHHAARPGVATREEIMVKDRAMLSHAAKCPAVQEQAG